MSWMDVFSLWGQIEAHLWQVISLHVSDTQAMISELMYHVIKSLPRHITGPAPCIQALQQPKEIVIISV